MKKLHVNNENFIDGRDRDDISRKIFSSAISIGVDFVKSKNIKNPVLAYASQKEIWSHLKEELPEEGKAITLVLNDFKNKILKYSINFSNPQYVGFPDVANSTAGQVGNILEGFINQNMINSESASPAGTLTDILVIQWLRKLLGFSCCNNPVRTNQVGGIATTGGVLSNAIGLILAREKLFKKMNKINAERIKIFTPKSISHYSIHRTAFWIGLPKDSVIEIEVDSNFCMKPEKLRESVENEIKKGNVPMAVVAYAGNSRTMSIDDLITIGNYCSEKQIWFHVDACHGFSLAFSNTLKKKIKGINLANSVTVDPHKVLMIPYNLSYLLVKDAKDMELVTEIADICTSEPLSLGSMTPFLGSVAFNSLKLWFLIQNLGRTGIGRIIEERHLLARNIEKMIIAEENLLILNEVVINSCLFYCLPAKYHGHVSNDVINKYNLVNKELHRRIFEEGKYYIHSFPIVDEGNKIDKKVKHKVHCLRIMPGNPLTTKKDISLLLNDLKKKAKDLEKQ